MKMEHVFDPNRSSPTSPSFPHVFSGNPGGIRTGPPIKTFGGDGFGSRIASPQPQFSKEVTKSTKERNTAAKNAKNANCRGTACGAPEITFVSFVVNFTLRPCAPPRYVWPILKSAAAFPPK